VKQFTHHAAPRWLQVAHFGSRNFYSQRQIRRRAMHHKHSWHISFRAHFALQTKHHYGRLVDLVKCKTTVQMQLKIM